MVSQKVRLFELVFPDEHELTNYSNWQYPID